MVESMLEIARLQSGKIELNLMPVNVHSLIPIRFLNSSSWREYKITIQNEVPSNLPQIFIDHNKINRVINNLLDNAEVYPIKVLFVAASFHEKDQVETRE
jgi:K+-sensing histidine kinase KdpD